MTPQEDGSAPLGHRGCFFVPLNKPEAVPVIPGGVAAIMAACQDTLFNP